MKRTLILFCLLGISINLNSFAQSSNLELPAYDRAKYFKALGLCAVAYLQSEIAVINYQNYLLRKLATQKISIQGKEATIFV